MPPSSSVTVIVQSATHNAFAACPNFPDSQNLTFSPPYTTPELGAPTCELRFHVPLFYRLRECFLLEQRGQAVGFFLLSAALLVHAATPSPRTISRPHLASMHSGTPRCLGRPPLQKKRMQSPGRAFQGPLLGIQKSGVLPTFLGNGLPPFQNIVVTQNKHANHLKQPH